MDSRLFLNRSDHPTPVNQAAKSVDVIVPCYQYGRFLRECVESVLSQSITGVRILIIDDASPDDTAEAAAHIAASNSRVAVLRHRINKGHIETYNEGIEWASAEYTLLLSADDYLLPGALERAIEFMERHPDAGCVFGKAMDHVGTVMKSDTLANRAVDTALNGADTRVLTGVEFVRLIRHYKSINIVRAPTVIVRTELQKRLGGYRPDLPHAGDLEMWLRFAAYASVGVMASYQAAYRVHGKNMQRQYYHARGFADLQQRKAAIEYAVIANPCSTWTTPRCRRQLLWPLGIEALRNASAAYNDDDRGLSVALEKFATDMNPYLRSTLPWMLLQCKRAMGRELSRALLPAIARLRRMTRVVER